jgi:hypothetical protein
LFLGLTNDAGVVVPVTHVSVHQVVPTVASNSRSLSPSVSPYL